MKIIASILLVLAIATMAFGQGSPSSCSHGGVNYGSLSNENIDNSDKIGSYSALSAASGTNPQGKYRFYWNICGVATQCKSSGTAACQMTVGGTAAPTAVGLLNQGSWQTVGGLTSLQYTTSSKCSSGNMRTMVISMQCNQNSNTIQATLVSEDKCIYSTTMSGKDLCGGGGGSGSGDNSGSNGGASPKKGGIGGGWIFIIILLSVTVVYIVGGIIFNAKVKHQHGSDMFPNKEMWVNFGGLIKDGVFFIKSKVTGTGGQGYQQV
ncbi:hypothetical protein ACTFIZ_005649 [Dictyostelium cf. discoideum]